MAAQEHRWILGGGLASGKTVVRRLLREVGVATVDADAVGHTMLDPDGPAFGEVSERWPAVVREGRISRPALAEIVFNDPEELAVLERITHPFIFGTIRGQVEKIKGPVVVEMPVLSRRLGPGWSLMVVDVRDDEKLRRAVARGMEEADATRRLRSQPSRREWLAAADLVIPNHGSITDLERAVEMVTGLL